VEFRRDDEVSLHPGYGESLTLMESPSRKIRPLCFRNPTGLSEPESFAQRIANELTMRCQAWLRQVDDLRNFTSVVRILWVRNLAPSVHGGSLGRTVVMVIAIVAVCAIMIVVQQSCAAAGTLKPERHQIMARTLLCLHFSSPSFQS